MLLKSQKNINASSNKQAELFWFENCFSFHKTRAPSRRNPANFNQPNYEKISLVSYFFNFLFFFYESVISSTKSQ
jgi:hypothetical protein